MPVFTFSGKDASGQKISGERNAPNNRSLRQQLRRERITPGSIREKGKEFSMPTFGSGKVKVKDIAIFFRQFSVMIDAGLPLVQCLEILAANQENQSFQKTLTGVRTTVEGGATLANAMRQYPVVFDDLTTNMIEAGETGGILDVILQRLATLRGKGCSPEIRREIGADLSRRGRQPCDSDCRRAAQVGCADFLPTCLPDWASRFLFPRASSWDLALSCRVSGGLFIGGRGRVGVSAQADPQASARPLLLRQDAC